MVEARLIGSRLFKLMFVYCLLSKMNKNKFDFQ
jgi:hypothetical protein